VGNAGKRSEQADDATAAEGEAKPRPTPLPWRIARSVAGALLLAVLVVGLWWVASGRRRSASDANACRAAVEDEWVRGGRECLHFRVYRSASLSAHPDLVVVLHGDSPFSDPSYQNAEARRISTEVDDVIAIGLLRPGYTDADGHRSSGIRGRTNGDNYTPADVDAVAAAIQGLTDTDLPARVFIVGHSGGAAIVGDLIARHPGLVNGAVLVSCPCDVPAWRRHMDSVQHTPVWGMPIESLSPMDLVAHVDPHTVVRVVVGTADPVTPPAFSRTYVQRLQAHGVRAQLVELPGAGHEILLDPRVLTTITDLLRSKE
jgi:pimeloyl-ACP methyl ester carboxylesterase